MKKLQALLAGAALALVPLTLARADDEKEVKKPELPSEIACPVSGAKVSVKAAMEKGNYADYEYGRYVFCCGNCPKAFAKDPAKFAEKDHLNLQDVPMPKAIKCAVMPDHEVDIKKATEKKMYADYEGHRYYFCCAGCPGAFKNEPAKFAKNASVPVGQLPLPKKVACAVMPDHEVDIQKALKTKMYADYKGKRYFFCCAGCPPAFKQDPAKFAANASLPSPKVEKKEADTAKS